MSKNRVPIIDKNGKATHVWKTDERGFNRVESVAGAAPMTLQGITKSMSDTMDNLWTQVQAVKGSVEAMNKLDESIPEQGTAKKAAWDKEYAALYENLTYAAIGAGTYIEDLELDLNVCEQTNDIESDDQFGDDYGVSVTEIRFQKSSLKKHLQDSGILNTDHILNSRTTRTWEDGVSAVEEVYGKPDITQELPNGSTTFRYESNSGSGEDDKGWREITVNRLGNVTRFNSENGEFTAASIDFPVANHTGGVTLRGETEGKLTDHDLQTIAFIATGNR